MSGQSAFDKRYVDPKDQSDVEGLLEHLNLPPKVIAFLRENKRAVQVTLAVIIIVVVAVSLYDSYRERQIEKAASSLTLALKEKGENQKNALTRIAEQYSSTPSGIWANVELAHMSMKEKDFQGARVMYEEVKQKLDKDNPLYALTLVGIAQADEALKNYDAALNSYEQLDQIEGYQLIGYMGIARIYESQGEYDKALGMLGQYLTVIGDEPETAQGRAVVKAKIARLKARQ